MNNPIFQYLNGKDYVLEGVDGMFIIERGGRREELKHLVKAPSVSTPGSLENRSQWGDNGHRILTEEVALYVTAAMELGYQFPDARLLPDPEDKDALRGAIHKAEFLRLRPDLKDHPKWAEYVSEAEHQDGLAYWDCFNTLEELVRDLEVYVAETGGL